MSREKSREVVLEEAVKNEQGRLLSFIGSRIRDQNEAEDILQEVFEEYILSQ